DDIGDDKFPKFVLQPVVTRRMREKTIQPEKFKVEVLAKNYLDPSTKIYFRYIDEFGTGDTTRMMVGLTANRQALYFHFNQFALQSFASDYSYVYPIARNVFDTFLSDARNAKRIGLKGIIIDLRGNGGGDIRDLNFLAGRLVDRDVTFGYNRYKNGDNRRDYTPWLPAVLHPHPAGSFAVEVPIVLLVDQNSVSMSEITTFALKAAYPQTTKIVGKTTWGGQGGLTGMTTFNAGVGYVGRDNRDIYFYTPVTAFKFIDGIMREGKGIAPDVDVDLDLGQLKKGIDTQLEAALNLLNK
ncbi:MAG: S41 family peptidase, partial [Cytophagales bacterium]